MKLFECDTIWYWHAEIGGRWFESFGTFSRAQDARRSGNAWARRMGLTPEWDDG
jgi:hypothetical protein